MTANESGTGYCKMPDGTLLEWGSESNAGSAERSWGTLTLRDFPNITFSQTFISPPSISIASVGGGSLFLITSVASTTGITAIQLARATSFPSAVQYSWLAIGR